MCMCSRLSSPPAPHVGFFSHSSIPRTPDWCCYCHQWIEMRVNWGSKTPEVQPTTLSYYADILFFDFQQWLLFGESTYEILTTDRQQCHFIYNVPFKQSLLYRQLSGLLSQLSLPLTSFKVCHTYTKQTNSKTLVVKLKQNALVMEKSEQITGIPDGRFILR